MKNLISDDWFINLFFGFLGLFLLMGLVAIVFHVITDIRDDGLPHEYGKIGNCTVYKLKKIYTTICPSGNAQTDWDEPQGKIMVHKRVETIRK